MTDILAVLRDDAAEQVRRALAELVQEATDVASSGTGAALPRVRAALVVAEAWTARFGALAEACAALLDEQAGAGLDDETVAEMTAPLVPAHPPAGVRAGLRLLAGGAELADVELPAPGGVVAIPRHLATALGVDPTAAAIADDVPPVGRPHRCAGCGEWFPTQHAVRAHHHRGLGAEPASETGPAGWTPLVRPPGLSERAAAIGAIRTALRQRSGKRWSVSGDRGTAYGWINICAPQSRLDADGDMTDADAKELHDLLAMGGQVRPGTISVEPRRRLEFVARARGEHTRPYYSGVGPE